MTGASNQQQARAWNGLESAHYVDHADRYDRQLMPFSLALLEAAAPTADHSLLDVGCGSGATVLEAAVIARHVVGVDLSRPLLDVARNRARAAGRTNVEFIEADAQTYTFNPPTFDTIISQFGLMFFDDPVAAFVNLRSALVAGGRCVFVCWQGLAANQWLTVVSQAVARHVPVPDLGGQANGPGMFALKDPDEIRALLDAAGFAGIDVTSVTPTIVLGGGGTLDDSLQFLLGTGIVKGLLSGVPGEHRDSAIAAIRGELEPHHVTGTGVPLGAAGWLVSATT